MDSQGKFQPGERVACAGQDYASHAEVVAVPQNLIARIPDNVSLEEAAFTTLGAIAMQGVRQADPKLGERIAVIGLGLLGQLTAQLLRANGCHVLGIDLSDRLIALAKEHSADEAYHRSNPDLIKICESFTKGFGFDSIIITAAAPTNDPIELSAVLARKKGKVIVVGAVKMDIPRDPDFYRKELELRMSCSYGPGRYDTSYEEDGHDYPFAYVRWTEQRNMEAFLELVSRRLQKSLMEYIQVSAKERKAAEGEKQYEELITFCVQYQGSKEDEVEDFLGALTNNQKNRTQFSMLMGNKVYAHEWMVILVLFSITLGFVLLLEIGDSAILILVKALLCTGLSMLLVILAKLSTLTHKKAKQIWDPFKKSTSSVPISGEIRPRPSSRSWTPSRISRSAIIT
jgi:NADPH:quinone reductase-like Zn-dependent oxidoreductase